jgi:hypothetical protein
MRALPQQRSDDASAGSAAIRSVTSLAGQQEQFSVRIEAVPLLQADESVRALALAKNSKGMAESDIDRLFAGDSKKLFSELI